MIRFVQLMHLFNSWQNMSYKIYLPCCRSYDECEKCTFLLWQFLLSIFPFSFGLPFGAKYKLILSTHGETLARHCQHPYGLLLSCSLALFLSCTLQTVEFLGEIGEMKFYLFPSKTCSPLPLASLLHLRSCFSLFIFPKRNVHC